MSQPDDRSFVGTDQWRAWAEEQLVGLGYPPPEADKTGSLAEQIAEQTRAILDAVTHTDLTSPQRDHALTLANLLLTTTTLPISLGTPETIKAANEAGIQWIQFLAGGYQVGAVCRVSPTAFEGEEGAKWNGKEGVAKAMRRGSVLVQFADGTEESFFAADLEGRFG